MSADPPQHTPHSVSSASVVGRRELIAVFDESGASNVPGEGTGDDFSLGAIVFDGRRAWSNLLELDASLQALCGREDYKYRQVRQNSDARKAVCETLNRQSGLIRVFAYYAAGGAFIEQAKRELEAVRVFKGDVRQAEENLRGLLESPRIKSLKDAIATSVPALSAYAASRAQRINVYFDKRTDLPMIASDLASHMKVASGAKVWGDSYNWMDWKGECPPELAAACRIADVFAGDVRATFKMHGDDVWKLVQPHGFVGRHEQAARSPSSQWAGLVPMPLIGTVTNDLWDQDWSSASTSTTMFRGYEQWLLAGRASLFSPCGRGCMLRRKGTELQVFQAMD